MKEDNVFLSPSQRSYFHRSATEKSWDVIISASLCIIAVPLLIAATIYMVLHSIWPTLAPVRAGDRRSSGSGRPSRTETAHAFLSRPLAQMQRIDPPATSNDEPKQPNYDAVERRSKRTGSGR